MDALRNDILSFWGLLKAYSFQKYFNFKKSINKTALWWPASLKHFLGPFLKANFFVQFQFQGVLAGPPPSQSNPRVAKNMEAPGGKSHGSRWCERVVPRRHHPSRKLHLGENPPKKNGTIKNTTTPNKTKCCHIYGYGWWCWFCLLRSKPWKNKQYKSISVEIQQINRWVQKAPTLSGKTT